MNQNQELSRNLIQSAGLNADAFDVLLDNLTPAAVSASTGTSVDDLATDMVTLYIRIFDRSGSMDSNRDLLITAANEQRDALLQAAGHENILMATWVFNQTVEVLHTFVPLENAVVLTPSNYAPGGYTALYGSFLEAIASTVPYVQSLKASGMSSVRVAFVMFSDGENYGVNDGKTAGDVKTVVLPLRKQEIYTFAMVGFGFDATDVALAMGLDAKNVMSPTADAHGFRAGLNEVSQSVISVSQSQIGGTSQSASFFN